VSEVMETSMHLKEELDIVRARALAKMLAQELGFGIVDQTRIATAISELARNVIVHATEGDLEIRPASREDGGKGLEIIVSDSGPGIADIEKAMRGGYSTSGGLGAGLVGVKRLMSEFRIESAAGQGTRVWVRKWL